MARPNRSEVISPEETYIVHVKRGGTPADTPAILQRLGLEADVWFELVHAL